MKIANVIRPSRYGDIIASLPFSTYLAKIFPNSQQIAFLDKSCSQAAQFLLNHSTIDTIHISEKCDAVTLNEKQFFITCDVVFDPYPPVTDPQWYNKRSIIEELFRMNRFWYRTEETIYPDEFDKLRPDEKKPKLVPWFDIERHTKTVALFPEAGYNNKDNTIAQRSPCNTFWWKLENLFYKAGYETVRLGLKDRPQWGLFDTIKFALGCDFVCTTDSGVGWILGAYGMNQVCIYTNYKNDHITNFDAFLPVNYKNNLLPFFGKDKNVNNVSQEEIIEAVKVFV